MNAQSRFGLGAAVLLAAGGCARPVGAPLPPRVQYGLATSATALGDGDRVTVRVFGEDTLSGEFRVDEGGNIDYPYLGRVPVRGLQASQVAEVIRHGLSGEPNGANVLRRPSVSVAITDVVSRPVSVLGQVQHPGVFQFTTRLTLAQAITQAGGFTALAAKGQVRVTRHFREGLAPTSGDARPAGVADAGASGTPGPSGTPGTSGARERSVTYVLDVDRILEGRDPDFDIQPNDVIFVPESIA